MELRKKGLILMIVGIALGICSNGILFTPIWKLYPFIQAFAVCIFFYGLVSKYYMSEKPLTLEWLKMKEDKEPSGIVFVIVMILIVACFIFLTYNFAFGIYDARYTVVDSKIIDIESIVNEYGELEYLNVTFENNETYKIKIYDDVDLTVNSDLILELKRFYRRTWVWEEFVPTDYYSINKIIKIPWYLEWEDDLCCLW